LRQEETEALKEKGKQRRGDVSCSRAWFLVVWLWEDNGEITGRRKGSAGTKEKQKNAGCLEVTEQGTTEDKSRW